jgi:hypothetical protein
LTAEGCSNCKLKNECGWYNLAGEGAYKIDGKTPCWNYVALNGKKPTTEE